MVATTRVDDDSALAVIEHRLRTMLPEEYQDSYEELQPLPMKSAGLKFDADGNVAWDEIWGSFCDLAMAGGPPHKGTLLEPAAKAEIEAQPERFAEVFEEIRRGIWMAADLHAQESPIPGWVRVACRSEAMAGWLLRAIVMENVAVHAEGSMLFLPVAPHFRLEKEIKNVITVIAKTCHYWTGHMRREQRLAIASLFAAMAEESPLIGPGFSRDGAQVAPDESLVAAMSDAILRETGLQTASHQYGGWLGVQCPSVRSAIWMMRALVVSNVLSRREGTVLFVPLNPAIDAGGRITTSIVVRIHRLAAGKGVAP
jgi:sirohydrochlorin cobaltochelatase